MNYALLNNGIVENIIWLNPKDEALFSNCVKLERIPVLIGDTYNAEDGKFYRNGIEVSWNMPRPEPIETEFSDEITTNEMFYDEQTNNI